MPCALGYGPTDPVPFENSQQRFITAVPVFLKWWCITANVWESLSALQEPSLPLIIQMCVSSGWLRDFLAVPDCGRPALGVVAKLHTAGINTTSSSRFARDFTDERDDFLEAERKLYKHVKTLTPMGKFCCPEKATFRSSSFTAFYHHWFAAINIPGQLAGCCSSPGMIHPLGFSESFQDCTFIQAGRNKNWKAAADEGLLRALGLKMCS